MGNFTAVNLHLTAVTENIVNTYPGNGKFFGSDKYLAVNHEKTRRRNNKIT